jgi:hypothetical protein
VALSLSRSVLALLQSLLAPEQTDESRKRDALKCLLGWLTCESLIIPIKFVSLHSIYSHITCQLHILIDSSADMCVVV